MFTRMLCNNSQKNAWLEASQSDRQTQEELQRRNSVDTGRQTQTLLDAINQAPDLYFQVTQQIKMSKWSNSRVIYLGDAAHAPTPLTGMGTSLAITGAYVLVGESSKLDDGDCPLKALEAHESIFRPFVEEIQKIPFFVLAVAHPETAWKTWLFQAFACAISKVVAIPWSAKRFEESNDDDFPLPHYPRFDDEGCM